MIDYSMAWMVVAGAGLLALGFWFLITRGISNRILRTLLRCLAAVLMLVPAPVPNHPGQFAPAYVVALFEAVFQADGEPEHAFIILGGSCVLVLLLVILWAVLTRRRGAKQPPAPAKQPPAPARREPVAQAP